VCDHHPRMDQVAGFLSAHDAAVAEDARWGDLRLRIMSYICADMPSLELITSARAVVLREGQVLVVRDPGGFHIVPGGRREAHEKPEQTVRREVLEETGWIIHDLRLLGVKHFRHMSPRPTGYSYPFPDFFQVVYVASSDKFSPLDQQKGQYELDAGFQPLAAVRRLTLTASDQAFLRAALGAVADL
jgi:ADP-ribose pyrophosphatase YjhB (NUDIX family)